jgi:type II secretory pathway pseudopilin PulG
MHSQRKDQAPRPNGFLLIEIIMSLVVLSLVAVTIMTVFSASFRSNAYSKEITRIRHVIKLKQEQIQSLGFWVKDVDTDAPVFPGNAADLAVVWKTELAAHGFSNRAVISTTFLKYSGGALTNFSASEFDTIETRDKVRVSVGLYSSRGGLISQDMTMFLPPTNQKLRAVLYIFQSALNQYYIETSAYPATNGLDALVSTYLAELPNDPYTTEKAKTTHVEEETDWSYVHTAVSNLIEISANSHPEIVVSWNY